MRFTRRLLERRFAAALAVVSSFTTAGMVASCSSDDEPRRSFDPADAGTDAFRAPEDAAGGDALRPRDAAPFDAVPLPVVCTVAPCATSLVTTNGTDDFNDDGRSEGFCALLQDGTVACWGGNAGGQLGRGEEAGIVDGPSAARVVGLSNVTALDHTCALDKNGAIWCWGTGPHLIGTDRATTELAPVKLALPPATKVAVGTTVGCAVIDGGVVCWGWNYNAQIKPWETANSMYDVLPPRAIVLPPGAPIRDLVVGAATFAIRTDGETVSWGANPPLGRVSSLAPDSKPGSVAVRGLSMIDLSVDTACAASGGVGYCWGASTVVLGNPDLDRALPMPVVTPEGIVQIATARKVTNYSLGVVQPWRWCAIGGSGDVYCGGYNDSGQAGDGTKSYAYEAVKVVGLPAPAAVVKTTPDATCALLTTGKIHCWGSNFFGQLGNGRLKVSSPASQEVILP